MPQAQYREQKHHGAASFAFNLYPCTIPGDFLAVPLHWQDEMELVYVKKGRGRVQVGPHWLDGAAGDVFILPPGVLHALAQAGDAVMEYENIIFELELLSGPGDLCTERYLLPLQSGRLALPVCLRPGDAGYPEIKTCLEQVEDAGRDRLPGYELAIKGAMLRLLALLLRDCAGELPPTDTADTRRLKSLMRYVDEQGMAAIPVAQAAAVCGCSASHFMRWFRQMTGQSFAAFLTERRLHAAAEALRSTDEQIVTLAGAAGFDNLSYFNRCFKRRYGQSPKQFRAAARAG